MHPFNGCKYFDRTTKYYEYDVLKYNIWSSSKASETMIRCVMVFGANGGTLLAAIAAVAAKRCNGKMPSHSESVVALCALQDLWSCREHVNG